MLSEKLVREFASTTIGSSVVSTFCLDGTFSEISQLHQAQLKANNFSKKIIGENRKAREKEKRKALIAKF